MLLDSHGNPSVSDQSVWTNVQIISIKSGLHLRRNTLYEGIGYCPHLFVSKNSGKGKLLA